MAGLVLKEPLAVVTRNATGVLVISEQAADRVWEDPTTMAQRYMIRAKEWSEVLTIAEWVKWLPYSEFAVPPFERFERLDVEPST
jgi:hypothetical protein